MKKRLGMLYLAGLLIIGGCGGPALPVDNAADMEIETKYVIISNNLFIISLLSWTD